MVSIWTPHSLHSGVSDILSVLNVMEFVLKASVQLVLCLQTLAVGLQVTCILLSQLPQFVSQQEVLFPCSQLAFLFAFPTLHTYPVQV